MATFPGQAELEALCESARRVAKLCELLGIGHHHQEEELLPTPGELELRLHHHHHHARDGAWILPEEL